MVKNFWNDSDSSRFSTLLEQRVYSSRLLGNDSDLVLHGGGNTSVKDERTNLFGHREKILYIKGSGHDLATLQTWGLPGIKLSPLQELDQLENLSDADMLNILRTQLIDSNAPNPSVEALLHAFLPHRFIDHTHAKAILTLTNQPSGIELIQKIFGKRVGVVPYAMPGFKLAKITSQIFQENPSVEGLILIKHGIFTFGDTAKESYEKMIELVREAEKYLTSQKVYKTPKKASPNKKLQQFWMQTVRKELLKRDFPCVLTLNSSDEAFSFCSHPHIEKLATQGPVTPDHAIYTKRIPLLLNEENVSSKNASFLSDALDKYIESYHQYFSRNCKRKQIQSSMLDPFPRVILVPQVGVISTGQSHQESHKIKDIYEQSISIMLGADKLGSYETLPEEDVFDVEYWNLQQAKLELGPKKLPLSGKVAVITGGANGIGLAIAKEFLDQGALVFIFDLNSERFPSLQEELLRHKKGGSEVYTTKVDVTQIKEVSEAFENVIETVGGVDIVIVNAGIFPSSAQIENIPSDVWNKSMNINLNGAFHTVSEGLRWLKNQESGGDIVFIASKNVPAPGKGAAAYSVSKAGQTQLARICALEGGPHGIRVNMLHPHLIFDTNIWTDEVLEKRAKAYSMTKKQYMSNNLLKTRLCSADVAKATFALVSGYFSKTTGAQIPIDGGSDRTL